MIVGAGLGGLLLGILLDRANIPYHIFERDSQVNHFGSATGLNADVLPIFEQLGLIDEIYKIALPYRKLRFFDGKVEKGTIDISGSKISFNKKVLRMQEKNSKVYIHCSDNTIYEGDILIGADGANSGVRQSLYRQLNGQALLPKDDLKPATVGLTCLVGIAEPKDPKKYPQLKDKESNFAQVFSGERLSLSDSDAKALQFRNSEWGPESNEAIMKEFENEPCPWGGTMGDVIKATPPDLVSRIFLEQQVFKTWYHGRTILIGDAVAMAFQDAVVLANCLYFMLDASSKSITKAFQEYHQQRYNRVQELCKEYVSIAQVSYDQAWFYRLVRNMILNLIPGSLRKRMFTNTFEYRPQIAWLPLVVNRGTASVLPQEGKRLSV
ncbi:hypothetical protein BGZ65_004332 [Modicella reniformis]|uniref:FAD-binding domain-containing protein n=1 Tax=Modicella reniformis TaxID=1440133 RepID=A0A9P6LYE2_9FUNG|nr:hypothetical protein BGZ65_004332 [Modicella reniformis]